MHPTACAGDTWPDLFALWESGFGEQVQDITLPTTIAVSNRQVFFVFVF